MQQTHSPRLILASGSAYRKALLSRLQLPFEVDSLPGGPRGRPGAPVDVLILSVPCPTWQERVPVHLIIHDFDDLRGALRPDSRGRTWRGDLARLMQLVANQGP